MDTPYKQENKLSTHQTRDQTKYCTTKTHITTKTRTKTTFLQTPLL
jgi:hypothetical protein